MDASDQIAGAVLSFDWITSLLQLGYEFLGSCVAVSGTGEELVKLQQAGVRCHAPMFIGHMSDDEYMWQIPKSQLQWAYHILGRKQ